MLPVPDGMPGAKAFCDMTAAEKVRVIESLEWLIREGHHL